MIDFFPIFILQAFMIQFLVFYGAGNLFIRLFFSKSKTFSIHYILFLGLFLLITVLSLLHLFLPINGKISWPFALLFSIISLLDLKNKIFIKQRTKRLFYFTISHLFLFLTILSILGSSKYENYDSGLYHLQVVRWFSEYPIIPGIGNLHTRLAFNSPWFLVPSFFFPLVKSGYIHYYAISFWYFVIMSYLITNCINYMFHKLNHLIFYLNFILFFYFLHLPLFIISISPDSIAYCLTIFIITESFSLFISDKNVYRVISLVVLSGLLVAIKILAVLCILPLFLLLYTHLKISRFSSEFRRSCFLLLFFFSLYSIRGYLMSGYFSYPLVFSFGDVDWKISNVYRMSEALEIKAYARHPGPGYLASLDQPISEWFLYWNETFGIHTISYFVKIGIVMFVLFVTGGFIYRNSEYRKFMLFGIFLIFGMIVWFFMAPDPRFVQGLLVFFVSFNTSYLVYNLFKKLFVGRLFIPILGIGFYLIFFLSNSGVRNPHTPDKIPTITSISFRVLNGIIYIPESGAEQCWNHELPCAPYKNPKLEFRGSDLSDGFRIRPEK